MFDSIIYMVMKIALDFIGFINCFLFMKFKCIFQYLIL